MTVKATCWLVSRRDGQVMRATNLDVDLEVTATGYAGTYLSSLGITNSAIKNSNTMAPDTIDISGATNAAREVASTFFVTPEEIENGLYDESRVKVFEVDADNPSTVRILVNGVIGQITRTYEGGYSAEVRNLFQLLQQQIGENISVTCRAKLGSGAETPAIKRCGKDLSALTFAGTVDTVIRERFTWADGSLTQDEQYFRDGIVTWLTGANAGYESQVRRHLIGGSDGAQLVLDDATPFTIAPGDTYSITPGCDHLFTTCRDKFDNAVNFRGEPYLPGMDAIIAGEGSE